MGFDNRRQESDELSRRLQSEQKSGNEMDAFLRQYFSSDRDSAYKLLQDASAKYGGLYDAYGNIAESGLADEYDFSRTGYRDLAGGMPALEKQQFEARAVAPVRGMWDAFKMQQERNKAATGAIGPGWDPANKAAIRQAGFGAESAGLSAQVAISQEDARRKEAGLAGEYGVASAINANKLTGRSGQMGATAGLAGIGSQYANMSNADLTALLQSKQISNDMITRLLTLRQSNPRDFEDLLKIFNSFYSWAGQMGGGSGAGAGAGG